jgi:hypothetical protein
MIINVSAIVITSTMVRVHENVWQVIFLNLKESYILLDLVSIKVNGDSNCTNHVYIRGATRTKPAGFSTPDIL